jgi:hypothetical protein
MFNPFERRATEFFRDDEAFLAVITPEPIRAFLGSAGKQGTLYDRLVIINGTPGSGKTTIARVYEFSALMSVLRNTEAHKVLSLTLKDTGALSSDVPTILACRIPLESSDYREIWELPYPEEVKHGLLISLLQARTVLGWHRQINRAMIDSSTVAIRTNEPGMALSLGAGASSFAELVSRASAVEGEIYKVIGSLIPPHPDKLQVGATTSYRPFDVLECVSLALPHRSGSLELSPHVILDDANTLHPAQLAFLQRWLIRRELRVGRWLLTRLDALSPQEAFALSQREGSTAELPGITLSREITLISLQSSNRREQRAGFRKVGRDMANRYMRQMPIFSTRKLEDFPTLLNETPEPLSPSKMADLEQNVAATQKRLHISENRRQQLNALIQEYRNGLAPDDHLALMNILLHRYSIRVDQRQLFGEEDPDPKRPLKVDLEMHDSARLHLHHNFGKAFFFGFDDLCDASSENAEQFLRLSAILIEAITTRLIKGNSPSISPEIQSKLLQERATEFLKAWVFPQFERVKNITAFVAQKALAESLSPRAWIGSGANAYGVLQSEFDDVTSKDVDLSNILKYGMAYNAFTLVQNYDCQNKTWCLIELGGIPCLHYGLTLRRGGFVKGTIAELREVISG